MIDTLWKLKRGVESIAYAREFLRLDPEDNYAQVMDILDIYMEIRVDKEAVKLMKSYPENFDLSWFWTPVLIQFRKRGDTQKARQLLKKAYDRNPDVLGMLISKSTDLDT